MEMKNLVSHRVRIKEALLFLAVLPFFCQAQVFGLMPANKAENLPTRTAIYLQYWGDIFYELNTSYRCNKIDTLFNVNINHWDEGKAIPYTNDLNKFKDTLLDITTLILTDYFTIENEEQHFFDNVYHSEGITKYCDELKAAASIFSDTAIKFTNGGFTLPVQYWYAAVSGDTNFKRIMCPGLNLSAPLIKQKIDSVAYEIKQLKAMPVNFVNNIHLYIVSHDQVKPLIRMIRYIKKKTGHEIICNEAGIYVDDLSLVNDLALIAKSTQMKLMIFYSGGETDQQAKEIPIDTIKKLQP